MSECPKDILNNVSIQNNDEQLDQQSESETTISYQNEQNIDHQNQQTNSKENNINLKKKDVNKAKVLKYERKSTYLAKGLTQVHKNEEYKQILNKNIQKQINKKQVENIDDDSHFEPKLFQGEAVMKEKNLKIIDDYFPQLTKKDYKKYKAKKVNVEEQLQLRAESIIKKNLEEFQDDNNQKLQNQNLKNKVNIRIEDDYDNDFSSDDEKSEQIENQTTINMLKKNNNISIIKEEDERNESIVNLNRNNDNLNKIKQQSTKQNGNDLTTQLMAEINQDEVNFIKDGYNEFKHLDENENVTQEFKQLQDQNIVERSGSTFFLTENIYHQITNIFKVETQYEIQVHSPEVVKSKLGLKKHVEFTVQLANLKENKVWTVKRRYKSFKFLESILKNDWPGIYIPPLPERAMDNITADNLLNTTYSGLSGSYSLQKIDERCRHFEYFLIKIMDNRLLAESQVVQTFLTMPNLKHLLKYLKNYKMMDMKQIVDKYTSIFSIFRTLPMTEEIKTKYVAFSKWTRRVKLRLMKMNQIAKRLKQNFNEGYNALNNFKDKFLIGYMEKFLEYDDAAQMYPALKDDFKPEVFDEICDLMQNELYDVLSLENAFDDVALFTLLQQKANQNQQSTLKSIIRNKYDLEKDVQNITFIRQTIEKLYGYYFIDNIRFTKIKIYHYLFAEICKQEEKNNQLTCKLWKELLVAPKGFQPFKNLNEYQIDIENPDQLDSDEEEEISEKEMQKKRKIYQLKRTKSEENLQVQMKKNFQQSKFPRKIRFHVFQQDPLPEALQKELKDIEIENQ